jgi:hypothetical protein
VRLPGRIQHLTESLRYAPQTLLGSAFGVGLSNKLEERDWRKLCELVAKETDPHKLPALLEELTEALNARANKFDIHPNAPLHRSETDAG